jgi:hypothetical protein
MRHGISGAERERENPSPFFLKGYGEGLCYPLIIMVQGFLASKAPTQKTLRREQ